MLTRRAFIKASAAVSIAALSTPTGLAFADQSHEPKKLVLFDEEAARTIAYSFAQSSSLPSSLTITATIPLYGSSANHTGYVVEFEQSGQPFGYVVLDTTVDGLIAEYSIKEGIIGPAGALHSKRSGESDLLIRRDAFLFGSVDATTGCGRDELGEAFSVPLDRTRSTIDSLMFDYDALFSSYTVLDQNTVEQFSAFDLDMLQGFDSAGRYACGVASAFAVCDNYGALRGSSLQSDFRTLWNLISPTKGSNGWDSTITTVASGVRSFCSQRGKTVLAETSTSKPTFSKVKQYINSNNLCSIALHTSVSEHMVTVEGWAEASKGGARAVSIPMLIVYDGWHSYPRCINYNSSFSVVQGIFYKGR
ncbi:hypothetical protein [uncultured Adlercreutzia sp.]|uniref:hypothetical protein n=1 Tax=uncultured Adlercreutzia sp. TaxID=875803 RepID=UPI0026F38471|nr:hypothetical protein [uncultured Adlercreutzia sp.]